MAGNENKIQQARTANGLIFVAAIWLILAPFGLDFSDLAMPMWNSLLAGVIVAVLAAIKLNKPLSFETLSWITFALGVWLFASPFILRFDAMEAANGVYVGGGGAPAAVWNTAVSGLAILVLSTWSAFTSRGRRSPGETSPTDRIR